MKRLLKLLKILVGIGLVALLLIMAFWPKSAAVDLAPVKRGPLTVTLDEEGKTRIREHFVVSAPVAGRVQRISLEPGDRVVQGETIVANFSPADPALLDIRSRTEAEASVKAAESALGQAKAERERIAAEERHAQSERVRMSVLFRDGLVAQQVMASSENEARVAEEALRAAEFSVENAQNEVAVARARLLSTSRKPGDPAQPIVIRAPITGVVLKRLRESEAIVPAGEPLVELGDPRKLEIVSDFLSTDAVRIQPGYPVRIERWGGEGVLRGRVRRIEPAGFMKISALGVEEQRVSVLIDFDDPFDAWKRLGDAYRVEVRVIVWQDQDVLKTPTSSLFRHEDHWAVFVAQEGRTRWHTPYNLARLREVEIGRRNGSEAQVLEGLSEGEQVIVHPSDAVKDGIRIASREP